MIENKKFNISELVSNYGCFDLQFRKDTRHKRTGSPTYYRWNTQFVITSPKEKIELLNKIGNELSMGMSNDYVVAIEEGSNMVRIGTALFGV